MIAQLLTAAELYAAIVLYSAASVLFFIGFMRPLGSRPWLPAGLLAFGGVLHALHAVTGSLVTGVCPVESLRFALSFSALMAIGGFLLLRRRQRLDPLGVLVAPLALAFLLGAEFVSFADNDVSSVPRSLLMLHIAANVVGVGLFLLAGAAGAFYVLEERRLKNKQLGSASRLPPLAALDRATHRLLLAGFPLLTFGVVTGSMFLDRLASVHGFELVRSLLGYASWLLLALVLLLRRLGGWSGRRAAYGTLVGVSGILVVMLAYVFGAS